MNETANKTNDKQSVTLERQPSRRADGLLTLFSQSLTPDSPNVDRRHAWYVGSKVDDTEGSPTEGLAVDVYYVLQSEDA